MGIGIQICGLNGCGKSALGKALAAEISFHYIDSERLYFDTENSTAAYAAPRSHEEVTQLLMQEICTYHNFVFASVRGNYGNEILSKYNYVIVIEVPKEIRLQRVRERSFRKFGNRMLPGGDLHEAEEAFFRMVASRGEDYIENWLQSVSCPILRIDGTKPIAESVQYILQAINKLL